MKNILLITTLLFTTLSFTQTRIGNTDRQKIDSLSFSNDTLAIRIENDVLRKVNIPTNIPDDAVTTSKIENAAVTLEKLSAIVQAILNEAVLSDDLRFTGFDRIPWMGSGTQAEFDALVSPPVDNLYVITDKVPMAVILTATWDADNGAVTLVGWKGVDDRTIDEPTITISDAGGGEQLTVYVNRATAPTLAGTGLTFNNITSNAFKANTEQKYEFEVTGIPGIIDYYIVDRE